MITRDQFNSYYKGRRMRWVYDGSEGVAVRFRDAIQCVTLENKEAGKRWDFYPISELEWVDPNDDPISGANGLPPTAFEESLDTLTKMLGVTKEEAISIAVRYTMAQDYEVLMRWHENNVDYIVDPECDACYWGEDANLKHSPGCPNAGNDNPLADADEHLADQLHDEQHLGEVHHHPDCQCDSCYYGADAAKWLNNPSEY